MLKGFKELTEHNLIHRDLKPENTLINDGVYKVADYGFSKKVPNYKNDLLKS
jgi:serine/threonine protein kinase